MYPYIYTLISIHFQIKNYAYARKSNVVTNRFLGDGVHPYSIRHTFEWAVKDMNGHWGLFISPNM